MRNIAIAAATLTLLAAGAASAQDRAPACPSQQELEQSIGSQGKFVPDNCRTLSITRVKTNIGSVCVLDFRAGKDPGVLDRLADAAVPTQWWIECDRLQPR